MKYGVFCDGYRWNRSLKAYGYSSLACGNSSFDFIHCCVPHIVINTHYLWCFKGGVSFLICGHGCRLSLLHITALFAEASQILQEVQVSLLQIPLCHIAGFFRASHTVQSFYLFLLVFPYSFLSFIILCKKNGMIGRKRGLETIFFLWGFSLFLFDEVLNTFVFHNY